MIQNGSVHSTAGAHEAHRNRDWKSQTGGLPFQCLCSRCCVGDLPKIVMQRILERSVAVDTSMSACSVGRESLDFILVSVAGTVFLRQSRVEK